MKTSNISRVFPRIRLAVLISLITFSFSFLSVSVIAGETGIDNRTPERLVSQDRGPGVLAAPVSSRASLDTLLFQDWEIGMDGWWVDSGVWEMGIPTVGPDSTPSGQNCAGTILGGNYPNYADTRLISPWVVLPTLLPEERIRLKYL